MSNPAKDLVVKACQSIDNMRSTLEEALPSDVTADRFTRVAKMALQQNPELVRVDDRSSLFNAFVRAAQQGLMPDGREGALVVFKSKDKATNAYVSKVQWMPMVYGIIKSAAKGGTTMRAVAVYKSDVDDGRIRFWIDEQGEHVTHEQNPFATDRGPMVGAYALAIDRGGRCFVEAMGQEQIDKARAASRSPNSGPWADWPEEMAKKTVLHRLAKRLPPELFSGAVAEAVREVEQDFDLDTGEIHAPPEAKSNVARLPSRRPSGLQKVVEAGQPVPAATVEPEAEPAAQAEDRDYPPPDEEEFF